MYGYTHVHVYSMVSDVADASKTYGKIDVSAPAIVGGQVTFTITMQRGCSQFDNWHYTFQKTKQIFHDDGNTVVIRKNENTYTLTLKNATSAYHKLNITFQCHQNPTDTATLELIGKFIFMSPPLWGRHLVFALSVCPSVRLSHFVSAQ